MKTIFFYSFIFILLNSKIYAQDSLAGLYSFTEDVRSVVLKAPGGNPMPGKKFLLTTVEADQMKALVGLDSLSKDFRSKITNKDCDHGKSNQTAAELEEKVKKRDMEIYISATFTDTKFEQDIIGRFTENEYNNHLSKLSFSGNKKASDINTVSSLEHVYQRNHPNVDYGKLSLKAKESVLNDYANLYLGVPLPAGMLMKELVFNNMVNNSSSWKASLAEAKDSLTNAQKIELVSKVGGLFGNKYNYTRFKEGDKAVGYVTIEKLFDSIKSGGEGGICRDIALAQTQMLKELGFTNNYVVTYKTLSGAHSNVISTDPLTGKIIKFNYGEATSVKAGSGTESLIQDTTMADHGLNYRIHDSEGKPVTKVSSELGNILKDATGMEGRMFTDTNYSIQKVGVDFGLMSGSLFTGKTSLGENIYGVAVFKKYDSEYLSLNGGISLSKIEGDRTFMKIEQENLYARLGAEVRTPSLDFGPASVGGFVGGSAEILAYNAIETSTSSKYSKSAKGEIDATGEVYVGLKGDLHLNTGTILTTKTYATFYPDLAQVADASKVVAVRDSVVLQSGLIQNIGNDQAVLIESTVMIKNYGTSMGFKAAYENYEDRLRVKAGFETPMTKDMPTFLPGGTSHAYVGVEKETKSGIVFAVEYDRDLTSKNNSFFLKASKRF